MKNTQSFTLLPRAFGLVCTLGILAGCSTPLSQSTHGVPSIVGTWRVDSLVLNGRTLPAGQTWEFRSDGTTLLTTTDVTKGNYSYRDGRLTTDFTFSNGKRDRRVMLVSFSGPTMRITNSTVGTYVMHRIAAGSATGAAPSSAPAASSAGPRTTTATAATFDSRGRRVGGSSKAKLTYDVDSRGIIHLKDISGPGVDPEMRRIIRKYATP